MENKSNFRFVVNFLVSVFVALFLLLAIFFSYIYLNLNLLELGFIIIVSVIMYGILLIVLLRTGRVVYRRKENKIINSIVKEVYGDKNDLNDIKINFIANSKNNIYHKPDCRLASKINPKFRLENSSEDFFKKKKFKKCKICFK